MNILIAALVFLSTAFFLPSSLVAAATEAGIVANSEEVLQQIMAIPEKGIPPLLLANASAVAIIPNVVKVGFVIGGRHGEGVLLVRNEAGNWGEPLFVSITGGSIGWQVGAQSTDVVLVFRNPRSIDNILKGQFTLGADAAVAAGPVGRRVEGATDTDLTAEIYSYSRSRGFFAGISLEGSSLQIDDAAVERFYGRDVRPREVLAGTVGNPGGKTEELRRLLEKYALAPR